MTIPLILEAVIHSNITRWIATATGGPGGVAGVVENDDDDNNMEFDVDFEYEFPYENEIDNTSCLNIPMKLHILRISPSNVSATA